ncbi:MAG: DUF547 domain-containing protein [Desulfobacterales bacterium]|nr:DUF547 domain-containing protein [Desulfobacterales bacterium]
MVAILNKRVVKGVYLTAFLIMMLTGCATIRPGGPGPLDANSGLTDTVFSHDKFDAVLSRAVDDRGRVNYRMLKENSNDLDAYLHLVSAFSPDSHPGLFPNRDHRLAYWINAYNAYTIKAVLVHYPISSVLDVKTPALAFFLTDKAGFFIFQRFMFGGATTNLYFLENNVIRKRFKDPRIHFAVNCASIGCPQLPNRAFNGELLDAQLDAETRKFVVEQRNVRVDHGHKTIWLSSIFKWYKSDFSESSLTVENEDIASGDIPPLIAYINHYLPPEAAAVLTDAAVSYPIRFVPYDWELNDQNRVPK